MYIYKGKDKAATGMFLDLLYKKYISNNDAVQRKKYGQIGLHQNLR